MKKIFTGLWMAIRGIAEEIFHAITTIGKMTWFLARVLSLFFRPPFYFKQIWRQIAHIGFFSLITVSFTALFTGMVLALQIKASLSGAGADDVSIAGIVLSAMVRELGPVFTGLMVSGRVGSSVAAEIGTMRVTEQIDALSSLSTDPMKYLVFPRILSGAFAVPLLTLVANVIGALGGYIIAVNRLKIDKELYISQTIEAIKFSDIGYSMLKGACFGLIVTFIGCYNGYYSGKGAEGVGSAAISTVVTSSIAILFLNYVLSSVFFG